MNDEKEPAMNHDSNQAAPPSPAEREDALRELEEATRQVAEGNLAMAQAWQQAAPDLETAQRILAGEIPEGWPPPTEDELARLRQSLAGLSATTARYQEQAARQAPLPVALPPAAPEPVEGTVVPRGEAVPAPAVPAARGDISNARFFGWVSAITVGASLLIGIILWIYAFAERHNVPTTVPQAMLGAFFILAVPAIVIGLWVISGLAGTLSRYWAWKKTLTPQQRMAVNLGEAAALVAAHEVMKESNRRQRERYAAAAAQHQASKETMGRIERETDQLIQQSYVSNLPGPGDDGQWAVRPAMWQQPGS